MRKKLVFHMGYHKTGSSSVQDWLLEHREILSEHLHCYNLADGSSNPLKLAVHRFVMGQEGKEAIHKECQHMREEIKALPQRLICYSDEGILGPPLGFRLGDFLETAVYPKASEVMEILAEELEEFAPTFFAMERQPESWLRSMHNQMAKQGCFSGDERAFTSAYAEKVDWQVLRGALKAGLAERGSLEFSSFEDEFRQPLVSGMRLFQLLEIPSEILAQCRAELQHVNKSTPLVNFAPPPDSGLALDRETIILAYKLMLDRTPDCKEINKMRQHVSSIAHLRHVILNSQEFRALLNKSWKQ